LSVGVFEPLFCKISLYDAKNEIFLNESHHCFLNSSKEDVAHISNFPQEFIDDQKKTILLTIPEIHSQIFLVVFVDRILQFNSQNDTYWKKKINLQTAKDSVTDSWKNTPMLKQPLFWTFEPLFEIDSQEKKKKGNDRTTIEKVFLRQGPRKLQKLYSNIGEFKSRIKLYEALLSPSNNAIKKAKLVPGFLGVTMEQVLDDKVFENEKQLLKYHKDYDSLFNLDFQHFLILELTSANLASVGATNIAVRVSLKEDDDMKHTMKKIHTRYSSDKWCEQEYSTVTYHQKGPQFFDEIRIDLPLNLTKNHHILFEFLDLDLKKQTQTEIPSSTVGYCVLRLASENLVDGHFIKDIYKELPAKYLEKVDSLEPIDKKKKTFKFTCNVHSTIIPKCPVTLQFLRMCPLILEKHQVDNNSVDLFEFFASILLPNVLSSTKNMIKSNFETIYSFLPSLLNISIYILVNGKEVTPEQKEKDPKYAEKMRDISKSAFELILALVSGTMKYFPTVKSRNEHLESYLQNIFDIPSFSVTPIHHIITEHWLELLNTIFNDDNRLLKSEVSESFRKVSKTETPKKPRGRGVSLFGGQNDKKKVETVINSTKDLKLVDSRDSLHLAWFIFELLSKSLFLYSKVQPDSSKKHHYSHKDLGKEDKFFDNMHFAGVLETLLKKTVEIGGEIALKTNNALALFIKDLLTISFQPNMIDSNFRSNTLNLLLEYSKHLDWRNSELVYTMKLDLVEIILDHENFVEMSWKLDQGTLSKYCIQILRDSFILDQHRTRVSSFSLKPS
jgi:hypothetical protein